MMPELEQLRGGYAKYAAAHGAADVDSALVLNTTYYLGLLAVACDAADASAERVYLDAAIDAAARTGPSGDGVTNSETAARTFRRLRQVDGDCTADAPWEGSLLLPIDLARLPSRFAI
jgi:hypothetical protein